MVEDLRCAGGKADEQIDAEGEVGAALRGQKSAKALG
jgi:hypothetical protein